jgi:hypothetical protein
MALNSLVWQKTDVSCLKNLIPLPEELFIELNNLN